ncbi:MAG TPA: hypothetical protein PLX56_13025 [bacterium]|nr:hypothetical protein [bacterium]
MTRLQKQLDQSLDEMVSGLPLKCDSGKATYLYELMDAGYDMSEIKTVS